MTVLRSALFLLFGISLSPVAMARESVEAPGVRVSGKAWNEIVIHNGKGEAVMTLGGIQVKGVPDGRTRAGKVEAKDGGFEVSYETGKEGQASPVKVTGRFTPKPWRVDVEFEVSGLPENADVGGSMFLRKFPVKADPGELLKPATWQRHPHGGVPFEVPDGQMIPYPGERPLVFAFARGNKINAAWKDGFSQHAGLVKAEGGKAATRFTVILPPAEWPVEALAASVNGQPVGLKVGSDKVYHWWTDASEPMALKADVFNVTPEDREVEISWWGRDYAGNIAGEGKKTVKVAAASSVSETVSFKQPVPRGIVFAEISAKDVKTGGEGFSRTNLVLLPPHDFKATSENSLFGLAAYWPVPSEADAAKLMERMGVRWLRHGDNRVHGKITAIHHSNPKWSGEKALVGAEREAWIRKELQQCIDEKNPWWEYGNELNMSTAGIAMEGVGIGQALLAEAYVDGLKEVHRIRKEMGAEHIRILSFGMAGMDLKFVEKFRALGGWDLIDGFALHPGRGNVAPDYPVSDPFEPWKIAPKGGYWNYYGSVKTAALMLKEYGGNKPLWLTEIYAPTFPNSFWEDSMRHATENVVLTFALAQAEGVKSAMWYQLFDSVWHDRFGANEKNREYHFGLMNRDLSFKPMVLAYAATAEALDEAKFNRWLRLADKDLKGMLFDSPRGPVTILWSRKDGYTLSRKKPDFASPEPWLDAWKTKTALKVPAVGGELTVIDPVGVPTVVSAADGGAEIRLDGAPRIIYGVDSAKLESER